MAEMDITIFLFLPVILIGTYLGIRTLILCLPDLKFLMAKEWFYLIYAFFGLLFASTLDLRNLHLFVPFVIITSLEALGYSLYVFVRQAYRRKKK